MKRGFQFITGILVAAASLALMACGGSGGGGGGGGDGAAANTPEQSFAAFKNALADGDTSTALNEVSSVHSQRVSDMIAAAKAKGYSPADMVLGLSELKLVQDRGNYKIYAATKTVKGKRYVFEVIFVLESGQWKILSL